MPVFENSVGNRLREAPISGLAIGSIFDVVIVPLVKEPASSEEITRRKGKIILLRSETKKTGKCWKERRGSKDLDLVYIFSFDLRAPIETEDLKNC